MTALTAGREVRVGDRIRDKDKRQAGRTLAVTALTTKTRVIIVHIGFATVQEAAVEARNGRDIAVIRRDRIHTDGKPRKSGWSLVGACA